MLPTPSPAALAALRLALALLLIVASGHGLAARLVGALDWAIDQYLWAALGTGTGGLVNVWREARRAVA